VTWKVTTPPEAEEVNTPGSVRIVFKIPAESAVGYLFVIVMATPSTVTDEPAARFEASCSAFVRVEAELTAARNPFSDAARACDVTSMNLGAAIAARMPRIRITTISSIRVKPRACFLIFVSLAN